MVFKKNVSNIDWWDEAIKNLLLVIIFSVPLTIIFVDKKIRKQRADQCPIILPPNKTIFCGRKNEGIKIIEIKIIPKKKKNENKKFLIIWIKS